MNNNSLVSLLLATCIVLLPLANSQQTFSLKNFIYTLYNAKSPAANEVFLSPVYKPNSITLTVEDTEIPTQRVGSFIIAAPSSGTPVNPAIGGDGVGTSNQYPNVLIKGGGSSNTSLTPQSGGRGTRKPYTIYPNLEVGGNVKPYPNPLIEGGGGGSPFNHYPYLPIGGGREEGEHGKYCASQSSRWEGTVNPYPNRREIGFLPYRSLHPIAPVMPIPIPSNPTIPDATLTVAPPVMIKPITLIPVIKTWPVFNGSRRNPLIDLIDGMARIRALSVLRCKTVSEMYNLNMPTFTMLSCNRFCPPSHRCVYARTSQPTSIGFCCPFFVSDYAIKVHTMVRRYSVIDEQFI